MNNNYYPYKNPSPNIIHSIENDIITITKTNSVILIEHLIKILDTHQMLNLHLLITLFENIIENKNISDKKIIYLIKLLSINLHTPSLKARLTRLAILNDRIELIQWLKKANLFVLSVALYASIRANDRQEFIDSLYTILPNTQLKDDIYILIDSLIDLITETGALDFLHILLDVKDPDFKEKLRKKLLKRLDYIKGDIKFLSDESDIYRYQQIISILEERLL